jgi:hypothetical protein
VRRRTNALTYEAETSLIELDRLVRIPDGQHGRKGVLNFGHHVPPKLIFYDCPQPGGKLGAGSGAEDERAGPQEIGQSMGDL